MTYNPFDKAAEKALDYFLTEWGLEDDLDKEETEYYVRELGKVIRKELSI